MTETTTFPFAAVDDSPTGGEPGGDRKSLAVVLGGGLLALAVVGGAVFAFTGGEEELALDAGFPAAAGTTNAAPPVEAELGQTVPAANTESIARNPFEPKYVEPAPVVEAPVETLVDPAGGPAVLPPSVVVPDQDGGLSPVPVTAAPGAPAGSPQSPPPAPAPREYRLVLTGVSNDGGVPTATFTIDGAVSTVKATEIFGPNRQLLLRSLQQGPKDGQWTATIQVGDARPIDVVTGEAVYVQ